MAKYLREVRHIDATEQDIAARLKAVGNETPSAIRLRDFLNYMLVADGVIATAVPPSRCGEQEERLHALQAV